MKTLNQSYDVFLSHNVRDTNLASNVADALTAQGIHVFRDWIDMQTGQGIEDQIWDALAECHALVLVLSDEPPNSRVYVELGAARAWNKQVFVVTTSASIGKIPTAIRDVPMVPISRVDEITRAVKAAREPISSEEQIFLGKTYQKTGVPLDKLLAQPSSLAKIVKEFNRECKKNLSSDNVISLLFRMRKNGELPRRVSLKSKAS